MENNSKIIGNSVVEVAGISIGKNNPVIYMAGPCTVEGENETLDLAKNIKESGAQIFRGGSFKPRTSPYSYQGLGYKALEILNKVNMPTVSEITAIEQIPSFIQNVDLIQVGARNMHNYELLKALGKINKPILLKRGFDATIEEWLCAAEYILVGGNKNVILCERGIRTFDRETRFTLDLGAVSYVKKISNLPVIVDPSHATGNAALVKDMSLAAIAAGADGLLIEVNTVPSKSISDAEQAISIDELKDIISKGNKIRDLLK